MHDDRWARLEALFEAAVELQPEERTAFLDRVCAADPELRAEIEAMLAAGDADGDVLEQVVAGAARAASLAAGAGQRLGPYELVRELGRGGMGSVFLARRADREYEAEVAIKVVRGFHTAEQLRHFRAERQILARLRHPNIAHLLDGGTTPDGLPYVVMERVDGVVLDHYCDRHRLGVEARLDLFLEICAAVEYAHQNLVVHCDLKPANILVSPERSPKLLDFGIARLLDTGPGGETLTLARHGTPAYASPEQISGAPVSVATDVHALGVILYDLLAGRLPYDRPDASPHELERLILEGDPPPPSVAAAAAGSGTAGARASTPVRLAARIRGDLDAIVLTALQPDPAKRYGTVEALAQDIRRHRAGLPVAARPAGRRYRAAKFLRRHRSGVSVAAAALVLVTAFTTTLATQAARLARERDAATLARREAEAVSTFLVDIFEMPDPSESRGNAITAREVLDRGASSLQERLADQPATRAAMMEVIGRVYANLGLAAEAFPLVDSSLALRRATFGGEDVSVAASLHTLAGVQMTLGRYDSARVLYHEALDLRRRLLPPRDPAIAETLDALASLESDAGNYDAAERLYREALAIDSVSLGAEHPTAIAVLANLGVTLRRKGDYAAAEPLIREGLRRGRLLYGTDHVYVGESLNQLGRLLTLQGRPAEAEPVVREELAVHRKVFGEGTVEVAYSLGSLSGILGDLGRLDEALAARRESLAIVRELYGDRHPLTAAALQSYAFAHHQLGQLDSARVNYLYSIELQRDLLDPDDPNRGFALTGLGQVLVDLDRPAEAEPHLREALRLRLGGLPPGHPFIAATRSALGECLERLGRYEEAETLLASAHAALAATFGTEDPRTIQARERLEEVKQEF